VSARTFFDRVEDPVLLVHGGNDDTCPPRWARESFAGLKQAGAPVRLAWYDGEGHAFGPQFTAAMDRSIGFFERAG
jgi:dipeptidyl aminopeptidase/acylaminoacyl peptidase